jgi:hypothetical protein
LFSQMSLVICIIVLLVSDQRIQNGCSPHLLNLWQIHPVFERLVELSKKRP